MRIQNYPGIATDPFGYAVVPYLTTYQENRLSVDTTQLPDNVDLEQTTQFVVPNRGAMVAAPLEHQYRLSHTLQSAIATVNRCPLALLPATMIRATKFIVNEGGRTIISLGYRVNHKAGLYAGEIRQIDDAVCFQYTGFRTYNLCITRHSAVPLRIKK